MNPGARGCESVDRELLGTIHVYALIKVHMPRQSTRRQMMKTAALAGGLLASRMVIAADTPESVKTIHSLAGEWMNESLESEPCAVIQQGRVLLVVNQRGDMAVGRITGSGAFHILKGVGWDSGLRGELTADGISITWSNGSRWTRG